ncbi:MAG: hypothetical protein CMH26_07240 [Micavibrio sp.]|nr:hypothetical protein [Micavibrio sp.]|tara:strand:+ start:4378 stop:5016 length:639 start_codon:yes stop_codon:yes gene_type:complete
MAKIILVVLFLFVALYMARQHLGVELPVNAPQISLPKINLNAPQKTSFKKPDFIGKPMDLTAENLTTLYTDIPCVDGPEYLEWQIELLEKYHHDRYIEKGTVTTILGNQSSTNKYNSTKTQLINDYKKVLDQGATCHSQDIEITNIEIEKDRPIAHVKARSQVSLKLPAASEGARMYTNLLADCTTTFIQGETHPIATKQECVATDQVTFGQ